MPEPMAWHPPVLAALADAAALIEGHFVAIGSDLDAALGLLERQTETFEALARELGGLSAEAAMAGLAAAIATVAGNTQEHHRISEGLDRLTQAVGQLHAHTPLLRAHARELTVLAMYTRVEGNRLGQEGIEFIAFTEQMSQSVQEVRSNLAAFEQEIETVARRIAEARNGHGAFVASHLAAFDQVSARLQQNLRTLQTHRDNVAACSSQVAEQSRRMQQQVGHAVLALQVGDSTRQRLEHVHALVAMMAMLAEPDAAADARADLLATGSLLAAALIAGAIGEFEQHVGDVKSVFQGLAQDARTTVQLGAFVSGREARDAAGGDLAAVQLGMQSIHSTLVAMRAAQAAPQAAIRAVKHSTGLLTSQIGLVQGVEGEMNMLEVNAALKCHRLGRLGASVSVITRELRGCGIRTAQQAASAIDDLQRLSAAAQGLVADEEPDAADASDGLVGQALTTLAAIGQQARGALSSLEQDGLEVIRLLERSAAGIVVHEDVGRLAGIASAGLPPVDAAGAERQPATIEMLERIARVYTMASERAVHAGIAGLAEGVTPDPVTVGDFML